MRWIEILLAGAAFWSLSRPLETRAVVDLADWRSRSLWLCDPVIGEPSFDTFRRGPYNPIYTGKAPYSWPVNGFLFQDPKSGGLYCYVSLYSQGYWPAGPVEVLTSRDQGRTWKDLGKVLQGSSEMFDGDGDQAGGTFDATVAMGTNGYHMIYSWTKPDNRDSGLGYAFSKSPSGPFQRAKQPIISGSNAALLPPGYQRIYAGTLIHRAKDWLILAAMSASTNSGAAGGALVALTAAKPEGPYSKPILLRAPGMGYWLPEPVEFSTAFVSGNEVFANFTSVAANRGYQLTLRAPLAAANRPQAWSVWQVGSAYHWNGATSEAHGIWGQSYSGIVGQRGAFDVMYPSRNDQNAGTINLASRPWRVPMGHGFWVSAPNAPKLALVLRQYRNFLLETAVEARGSWSFIWNFDAPLGSDRVGVDARLDPLTTRNFTGLTFQGHNWRLETVLPDGQTNVLSSGQLPGNGEQYRISVSQLAETVQIRGNGVRLAEVALPRIGGGLGFLTPEGTVLHVSRMTMVGVGASRPWMLLPSEGMLGAGNSPKRWIAGTSAFHYNQGFVGYFKGARAKWNFMGTRAVLWAPHGPDLGRAAVVLDGREVGVLNLHARVVLKSRMVWSSPSLALAPHSVALVQQSGGLPVDCLQFVR